MKILQRILSTTLLIIAVAFLLCSVTGCSSVKYEHTNETQVMLTVPEELLEPLQPLITIDQHKQK